MGTTGKQGLTKPPQTAVRKDGVPVNVTPLRDDTLAASQAFIKQKIHEKRSYLKAAFANPYNLSLLVGGLAASALTLNPLLAVITVGLEILWVVNAPGSKKLQEWLWDPKFDEQQQAQEQAARAARLQSLDEADRERVVSLFARQQEINGLAAQNPSFTGELLRTELTKTDRLVEAFMEMAMTCGRYEAYLNSIDLSELEKRPAALGSNRQSAGQRGRQANGLGNGHRPQESRRHHETLRQDEGDSPLPDAGARTTRSDRELFSVDCRSDRHDAVAAGINRAAR